MVVWALSNDFCCCVLCVALVSSGCFMIRVVMSATEMLSPSTIYSSGMPSHMYLLLVQDSIPAIAAHLCLALSCVSWACSVQACRLSPQWPGSGTRPSWSCGACVGSGTSLIILLGKTLAACIILLSLPASCYVPPLLCCVLVSLNFGLHGGVLGMCCVDLHSRFATVGSWCFGESLSASDDHLE